MGSQNGTDTQPTRDHLELLPKVDRWLVKLFKYRTRCVRGARAVRARCGYSPVERVFAVC